MRIVITGGGGFLGGRLCSLLSDGHETIAMIRSRSAPVGITALSLDLTDEGAVASALRRLRPDAVIHCAALADSNACERDPGRAHADNATATRLVARGCRVAGARLLSISTDLVLGGDRAFSSEGATANPIMLYGRSKLEAEQAAFKESKDAVVLRIALLCGLGYGRKLSATETVSRRLARGEPVELFDDEWRTPIDPESVAQAIAAVLVRPHVGGLFHVGGSERLTRYELGQRVAETLGLDPGLIRRSKRASHQGAARPRDVSLDISRAREELAWTPRPLSLAILEGRTGRATSGDP